MATVNGTGRAPIARLTWTGSIATFATLHHIPRMVAVIVFGSTMTAIVGVLFTGNPAGALVGLGMVVFVLVLQSALLGRALRQHAVRPDRWLWWQADPWFTLMAKPAREGGWLVHSLTAHPRGNGGAAFALITGATCQLEGAVHLRAANAKLASKYESLGFVRTGHIDRTSGAISMTWNGVCAPTPIRPGPQSTSWTSLDPIPFS